MLFQMSVVVSKKNFYEILTDEDEAVRGLSLAGLEQIVANVSSIQSRP